MADKSDDNLMSALAYIFGWLSGLIVYFVKKDSKVCKLHALQSILLSVVEVVCIFAVMIVVSILGIVLGAVTSGCGTLLIPIFMLLLMLCIIGLTIFLAYKAYTGAKFKLPVIGDMAEKYSA